RIGVTAGASAPEVLVQQVIDRLKEWGAAGVQEQAGREESITFVLPKELRVTSTPSEEGQC
ncbi:MAG: 4-hydroxy-3-methylbut-2-enyl diphosphate reductase, partial [Thiogranum sp.]|nr:4-hydroxy-3-methylbut-2-enyl diphosphate reductase [Thiogranum sp.]